MSTDLSPAHIVALRLGPPEASTTTIKARHVDASLDGQCIVNKTDSSIWIYDADSSSGASSTVLVPDVGSGRWLKLAFSDGMAGSDLASDANGDGASLVAIEDAGTLYTATDVEGALAEVKPLADDAYAARVQKKTLTVGHADLTDADGSQTVNLDTALPANARIVGVNVKLATPFSGGTASAVSVDVGSAGDPDALVDGADLFAAAVDGQASTMPSGIAPHKHFALSTQLTATFAANDDVLDLTAGACTIEVLYAVLA
jgi:hypothetical protein